MEEGMPKTLKDLALRLNIKRDENIDKMRAVVGTDRCRAPK